MLRLRLPSVTVEAEPYSRLLQDWRLQWWSCQESLAEAAALSGDATNGCTAAVNRGWERRAGGCRVAVAATAAAGEAPATALLRLMPVPCDDSVLGQPEPGRPGPTSLLTGSLKDVTGMFDCSETSLS